jgi:hypothetical protein
MNPKQMTSGPRVRFTPMRESCSLAPGNPFVALPRATSRDDVGRISLGMDVQWHNGPSHPAQGPQMWGHMDVV